VFAYRSFDFASGEVHESDILSQGSDAVANAIAVTENGILVGGSVDGQPVLALFEGGAVVSAQGLIYDG
jgi:hypothetical protein